MWYFLVILSQGKVKYEEHVTEGFDNMFEALFKGENIGKAVVKV